MPHRTQSPPANVENCPLEPIAIVGQACRLPGGIDTSSALWEVLINKKSVKTAKVPKSRFNIDAHLHQNLERPGSFNAAGGYFLDEDLENDFDPTFFGITPIEAMWMDPQHRKMLEVSYECLESAGLTLDDVDGSNTAVFVGTFTSDFQQMCMTEKNFRHTYAATGVDPGIISNRIGNTFNLKGPSFTINTACSSSIYAIHNACHALRAKDCEAAIAGGVNLILTVDQHMNTAKMGVLSPTSTCHTFDESADGYGRAEGVGALYLKRLSDAIRDGDPIRGVIRTSAVNTNGKVAGMAISYPGIEGQERVIRQAYNRSNLDPNRTIYAECHGTGTAIGDPIEVRAVSRAMNDNRSTNKPLIIGAVKANIGHSEAASGIFAVMKAALMTEAGVIPGVCGLKKVNPKIPEDEWNVNVNRETRSWPEDGMARRAGVSSFGYGGTNGHVVVEEVNFLYPSYEHGKPKSAAHYDHSSSRPFLVSLTAHDKTTLTRNIEAHGKIADQFYLADLAYTLAKKRTILSHRAFSIVREGKEAENFAVPAFKFGVAPNTVPDLAFIFTGQGAQYAGMGIEAMKTFPRFSMTIDALDSVLRQLKNPPPWSLRSAISALGDKSNIGDAEIAQPATTAIQIAMIDLFASWKIFPTVSVGHSSGEIGAAYAAGFISAPEAIIAAYYRGYAVKRNSPVGTMLAVGLGVEDVSKYIDGLADVVVACENSPASVTLSGKHDSIQEAKERLDADQVFARELKTGKAYHSPQMEDVAVAYDALLAEALSTLGWSDREWRQPKTRWISSVTGKEFNEELTPQYWSRNLRNRVLFNSAITSLGNASDLENVRCVLELGPHSALKGPLMEIFKANKFERFTYVATLLRKADSSDALLATAGSLFVQNHTVDLQAVNAVEYAPRGSAARAVKTSFLPLMLVDLPRYQWNYEKRYWAESRSSHQQRNIQYGRHDVLGMRSVGLTDNCLVWYNNLRHKDLPWLQDHRLGNVAVFPAAGHFSLAVEAVRQISELKNLQIKGVLFRDIAIQQALVIPEVEDGIEIQFRMSPFKNAHDSSVWYSFAIESITDGVWTKHCEGTVCALLNDCKNITASLPCPVDIADLQQRVPSRRWYKAFERIGFEYGPSFQRLGTVRSDGKNYQAAADVEIVTECGLVQGESRYMIHPATIDSCLHLMIVSTLKGLHKEMDAGIVPVNIEQMSMWFPQGEDNSTGNALAWSDRPPADVASRHRNCHMKLNDETGSLVLEIQGLRTVKYEAAVPQSSKVAVPRAPYMQTSWKPDITSMGTSSLTPASLAETLELLDHKQAFGKIAFVGWSEKSLQELLCSVSSSTDVLICGNSADKLDALQSALNTSHRISTAVMDNGSFSSGVEDMEDAASLPTQDVVVLNAEVLENAQDSMRSIKSLLGESGKLVVHSRKDDRIIEKAVTAAGFSPAELQFVSADMNICIHDAAPHMNGYVPTPETITLLTVDSKSSATSDLVSLLTDDYRTVDVVEVDNFEKAHEKIVVVDDGSVLSSLTEKRFDCLKKVLLSKASIVWVTFGVNAGENVDGSMVQGFLRAIKSEQATSKIALLDVDKDSAKEDVSRAVLSKLKYAATKDSGADTEFWLHNGALHINRLLPNAVLNEIFQPDNLRVEPKIMPSGESLKGLLVDGEMVFAPYDRYGRSVNGDEVEVQVLTAGFDLPGSGNARLVAGTVIREGPEVSPSMLGKEVIMYATDSYSTILRAAASHVVPTSGFVAANLVASLPRIAEAWNAIINVGKVQAGDLVLLLHTHSTLAAVVSSLASIIGFRLTVVVKSEQEQADLAAQGIKAESFLLVTGADSIASVASFVAEKKPHLVLAHDFNAMSQDIWRIMPAMGKFVLHDAKIDTAPDVRPFNRGAAFLSTGINSLLKQDPTTLRSVLKSSMDCWTQFEEHTEASHIPISSLKDAARIGEAKLTNNAVITYVYDSSMEKLNIRIKAPELLFEPDATYLLVGCLGGLGRSLTSWMMERGARSFAFISRSGDDKPEAARVVANIRKAGLEALVYRADAADEAQVVKVVKSITRPIRGVVHAAMVLQDTMFERMTYEKFTAAVVPKVQGAKALENAIEKEGKPSDDLDFFVMTSSISAQIGNPSQSNYSAANSFLDGLARSRTLKGLPGVSLVLPMVLDVGVVAENENIELSLTRQSMYGIDEREMLRGFETAMMQSLVSKFHTHVPESTTTNFGKSEIVLGFEPGELCNVITPSSDSYWLSDCRFQQPLRTVADIARANGSGQKGGDNNFASQLQAAVAEGPEVVVETIATHVMERCAGILMLEVEDFSLDEASVASYGLDSMIGAELRNWLFKEFSLDISFQHLLAANMTFKKLAVTIGENMGVLEAA